MPSTRRSSRWPWLLAALLAWYELDKRKAAERKERELALYERLRAPSCKEFPSTLRRALDKGLV